MTAGRRSQSGARSVIGHSSRNGPRSKVSMAGIMADRTSPARRRQTVGAAVVSHCLLLLGENAQIGACVGAAQQDEAGSPVLGVVAACLGLVYVALEESGGAGRTP